METKAYVVYIARNTVNGKCYIGVTGAGLDVRRANHLNHARLGKGGCRVFNAALRKYGADAFEWSVIGTLKDRAEAVACEIRMIEEHRPAYNISIGGYGLNGLVRTPEWQEKIAKALRGRKLSPERRAKLLACRPSPETFWKPVACLDDGLWFPSVKAAAAHYGIGKKRISTICLGHEISANGRHFVHSDRELTAEERAAHLAMGHARRGAFKKKFRGARRRPVICLNDGVAHESATAAGAAYGISNARVMQICKRGGETSTGLRFMYAEDDAPPEKRVKTADELRRAQTLRDAGLRRAWQGRQKTVICITDGRRFDSISDAARAYSTTAALVSAAIHRNGKASGLAFRFADAAQ